MSKVIRLVNNQQIGDCLKITTIAKMFKEQYPEYELQVSVSHPVVFKHNPYIENQGLPTFEVKDANEEGCLERNELIIHCRQDDKDEAGNDIQNKWSIHGLKFNQASFTQGLVGYINARYGFDLEVTQEEPDIHLTDEEKMPFPELPEKYWVVNAGSEYKNTRKQYPRQYYKAIFDALPDVTFVQNGLTKDNHQPFDDCPNVINGLDKYNIRDTIRMIYHSQGVLTPISWNMHCGAAFHKPVVALAGGGEDVSWENYKYRGFHYLHTIGALECCQHGGCWKNDCTNKDEKGEQKCMAMIKPELVVNVIKRYL